MAVECQHGVLGNQLRAVEIKCNTSLDVVVAEVTQIGRQQQGRAVA
jgi:hypothetical protein